MGTMLAYFAVTLLPRPNVPLNVGRGGEVGLREWKALQGGGGN